ncbi:hypothetical protein HDU79_005320 [Rhizoclosmatium sp. JEL0117]|nr:hypothetical protein HDU79_005320 [Rhizoclosmatium sp. JEL0117]
MHTASASVALRLASASETGHQSVAVLSADKCQVGLRTHSGEVKKTFTFDYIPTNPEVDLPLASLVEDAVAGHNKALFTASVGRFLTQQQRIAVFRPVFSHLLRLANNSSISYGYFGVTDAKLMNLETERTISASSISSDMTPLLTPMDSPEVVETLLQRECTLPSIFYFRVESFKPVRTVGTLCLIDLGHPCFLPTTDTSYVCSGASVTGSLSIFKKIVSRFSSASSLGPIPYSESILTTLCSPFLGGNGHATFLLAVDPSDKFTSTESEHAIELFHSFRKLKSVQLLNRVDARLTTEEKKCTSLQQEIKTLKDASEVQNNTISVHTARIQELTCLLESTRQETARRISDTQKQRDAEVTEMARKYELLLKEADLAADKKVAEVLEDAKRRLQDVVKDGEKRLADTMRMNEQEKEKWILEKADMEKKLSQSKEELHAQATHIMKEYEDKLGEMNLQKLTLVEELQKQTALRAFVDAERYTKVREIESLERANTLLNTELEKLTRAHSLAQKSATESYDAYSSLKLQVSQLQESISIITDSLALSQQETMTVHNQLTSSTETLTTQIMQLENEKQELREANEQLSKKLAERKKAYKESLAALEKESEQTLATELANLKASLATEHTSEVVALVEQHQDKMREFKKQLTKSGMDQTCEAQTRADEIEAQLEKQARDHVRELRKVKAEVQGTIKDLEDRLEESEGVIEVWKRDVERLQKALHRAIEMGKKSLEDFEKEVDGERDLWDVERKALKNKIATLENRLMSISETLKSANEMQKVQLPEEVHKSIMVAAEVPPKSAEQEDKPIPRRRARMSDVSDLLEISAKVGKSVPEKRKRAPVSKKAVIDESEEDEEKTDKVEHKPTTKASSKSSRKSDNTGIDNIEYVKADKVKATKDKEKSVDHESSGSSASELVHSHKESKRKVVVTPVAVAEAEPINLEKDEAPSESEITTVKKKGPRKQKSTASATEPPVVSEEGLTETNQVQLPKTASASTAPSLTVDIRPKKSKKIVEEKDDDAVTESQEMAEPSTSSLTTQANKKKSTGWKEYQPPVLAGRRKREPIATLEAMDDDDDPEATNVKDNAEEDEFTAPMSKKDETSATVAPKKKEKSNKENERKPKGSSKAAASVSNEAVADEDGMGNNAVPTGEGETGSITKPKKRKATVASKSVEEKATEDDANAKDASTEKASKGMEKKKRKLSAKAITAEEAEELPKAATAGSSVLGALVPKSPVKKPMFSFSKPNLSMLPGFSLGASSIGGGGSVANPYSIGLGLDTSVVSEFERQRKKRMEMLLAGQSQS